MAEPLLMPYQDLCACGGAKSKTARMCWDCRCGGRQRSARRRCAQAAMSNPP